MRAFPHPVRSAARPAARLRRFLNVLLILFVTLGGLGGLNAGPLTTGSVAFAGTLSTDPNLPKCRATNAPPTPGMTPTVNGNTQWVNINLDAFIPNAQCWMNDTFFTIRTFELFKVMAGFGTIVLMIMVFKQCFDGWTSRNFGLIGRTLLMGIVASVLINDAAGPGTITNQVYTIPIELWRTLYSQSSGLVEGTVQTNVTNNTQQLAEATGLFIMDSMLATNAMINSEVQGKTAFAADINSAAPANAQSAVSLTSQAAVNAYTTSQNKQFSDAVKGLSWVFQIGYLILLSFFMGFAGIIYMSGLTVILCMFALPLAIAFWATGDSRSLQIIFKTVLVSLATVSIVPIVMSIAADLAIIQPTYTIKAQMKDAQSHADSIITDYVNKSADCAAQSGNIVTKALANAADSVTAGTTTALQKVQCELTNNVPAILQEFAAGTLRIAIGMLVMIMTMLMCIAIGVALMRHTPALLGQIFGGASQGSDHTNGGAIAGGVLGGVAQGAMSLAGRAGQSLSKKADGPAAVKEGQPSKLASPVGRAIDNFNLRTGRPALATGGIPMYAMTTPSRNVLTAAGRSNLRAAVVSTMTAPVTARTAALGAAVTGARQQFTAQVKSAVQERAKNALAQVVAHAERGGNTDRPTVNLKKDPPPPPAPFGAVRSAPQAYAGPSPFGAVRVAQVTLGSGLAAGVALAVQTSGSTTTAAALAGGLTVTMRPPVPMAEGKEAVQGFGPVRQVQSQTPGTARPAPFGAVPNRELPKPGALPGGSGSGNVVNGTAGTSMPVRETLGTAGRTVTLNAGGLYAAAHPERVDENDRRQAKLDRQAQRENARAMSAGMTATGLVGLAVRERIVTSLREQRQERADGRTAARLERSGKTGLSAEARADHRAIKAAVIGHNRTERLNAAKHKDAPPPVLIRYAEAKAALAAAGKLPSQRGQGEQAPGKTPGAEAHERRVAARGGDAAAGSGREAGVRAPLGRPERLNREGLAAATGGNVGTGRYQALVNANAEQARRVRQDRLKRQAYAGGLVSRLTYDANQAVRAQVQAAAPQVKQAVQNARDRAAAHVARSVMEARDRRAVIDRNDHDNQKAGQYRTGLNDTRAAMEKAGELPSQRAAQAARKERPERIQAQDRTAINHELQRHNAQVDRRNDALKQQNPYNRLEPHRTAEEQNREMRLQGTLPSQIKADREHVRQVQQAHNDGETRRAQRAAREGETYTPRYLSEREVRHSLAHPKTPGRLPSQQDGSQDAYLAGVRLSRDVNAVIENERAARRGQLDRWTSEQETRYDPRRPPRRNTTRPKRSNTD